MFFVNIKDIFTKCIGKKKSFQNDIKNLPTISLINKPITKRKDDLLGYVSQANSIKQAILNGANMIGIIADYGAGKSSLTDMLALDCRFYKKPIKINLWDCLNSNLANSNKDEKVSQLTKSFLYQMALGNYKNPLLAQYVNKRLSKNFGVLSLGFTNKIIWFWGILALFIYFLPFISIAWINMALDNGNEILVNWKNWFEATRIIFNLGAVLVLLLYICLNRKNFIYFLFGTCILLTFPNFMINIIGMTINAGIDSLRIWLPWWEFAKNIAPFVAIFIGINVASKGNIAFSSWDSQGRREPEVSDIYSTYNEIIKQICGYKVFGYTFKYQLVIMEDLDRTDDKLIVQSFLKELYKFNNLLSEEMKKSIVFIISVKPENRLKIINTKNASEETPKENMPIENTSCNLEADEKIYSKVFDYIIYLGTIHNDDYKTIVMSLLKPLSKEVYKLTGIDLNIETFPPEFSWLIKGNNLSVRDIKNRINIAFSTYYRLKTLKQVEGFDIKFENCAIVAYLQETFSKAYSEILTYEKLLSDIVKIAQYQRLNATKTAEAQVAFLNSEISKEFNSSVENKEEFIKEFAILLQKNLISDDFRMYFYNYPKEGYIYTIDERMVREYILEPKEEIDIFEEKIGEVQVSNPELIRKTIEELVEQKLGMPKSIYKSHLILEKSYRYYSKEVVSSFISSLRWDEHQLKNSANILNYIANSKFPEKKQMWKELIDALIINLNTLEKEQLLIVRKIIMEAFIDNIELIKEVFINENMPIISSDEIFNISTITSRINYIKKEAISDSNSEYISKAIVGEYDINSIEEAVQLFDKLINISQSEIVYKKALIFLQINNLINIKIFTKIMELDKDIDETIGQYLDRLDVAIIPNEYYYAIDKRNMKKYISERILLELKNRKYYHSYLLSMSINNRLFEINFCELDKENFVSTMVYFFKNYVDEFNKIRKAFIKAHIFDNETRKLFFAPYLPITFEELLEIQPISVGLQYIDRVRFSNSQEDIELLSKYANSTIKSNEDLLCYVKYICSKEIPFDKTYIRAVFNELDFSKIIFFNLTEEQQTDIVDILTNVFNLIDPKAAIDFMIKVKCPIVKLEKSICSNDGELIDQTIGKEYFSFISDIEHFTKETIEICKNNYFYVSLWEEIENEFLMVNDNISYLISNILRKQTFEFDIDDEGFSVSDYSEVFMNIEECRNIMENNKEFLLYLVKNKGYEEFELETLKPLLKVRQTIDIVKYAFTLMTTQEEKKDYLNNMIDLDTDEESKLFLEFMLLPENIELIKDDSRTKTAIENRFWNEYQKKKYRRGVNEYFRQLATPV